MVPDAARAGVGGLVLVAVLVFFEGPGFVGLDLLRTDAADLRVVEAFGVSAEALGETQDGVEADIAQAGGGADTGAFGAVFGDGHQGRQGCAQAEQGVLARSEKSVPQVAQCKQRMRCPRPDKPCRRRLPALRWP